MTTLRAIRIFAVPVVRLAWRGSAKSNHKRSTRTTQQIVQLLLSKGKVCAWLWQGWLEQGGLCGNEGSIGSCIRGRQWRNEFKFDFNHKPSWGKNVTKIVILTKLLDRLHIWILRLTITMLTSIPHSFLCQMSSPGRNGSPPTWRRRPVLLAFSSSASPCRRMPLWARVFENICGRINFAERIRQLARNYDRPIIH